MSVILIFLTKVGQIILFLGLTFRCRVSRSSVLLPRTSKAKAKSCVFCPHGTGILIHWLVWWLLWWKINVQKARFEFPIVLTTNIVLRDVITCNLISSYQWFGAKNCVHGISSVLNMEAVGAFKTLIASCLTTCCHDPEEIMFKITWNQKSMCLITVLNRFSVCFMKCCIVFFIHPS